MKRGCLGGGGEGEQRSKWRRVGLRVRGAGRLRAGWLQAVVCISFARESTCSWVGIYVLSISGPGGTRGTPRLSAWAQDSPARENAQWVRAPGSRPPRALVANHKSRFWLFTGMMSVGHRASAPRSRVPEFSSESVFMLRFLLTWDPSLSPA